MMGVRILLDDGSDGALLARRPKTEEETSFTVRMTSPWQVVFVGTEDYETTTTFALLETR